ncbi:MAG: serine/threonine protein kinase [Acidimicrobiia bacterium]|nr:serine/threonine protein kinase [Acidimicrobiia bacterium]
MTEVPPLSLAAQLTGQTLAGRYHLDRLIAAGGMAHVWQATDEVLGRTVAVKILHSHLSADEAFVQRFRHEAVAAAKVVHPGIVSMYDTVSADGVDALVMQYVPGETLRQRLDASGRMPLDEIAPLVLTVAEALEAAHQQGVVHRDIKPANLLVSDEGQVLIADFGIAKATSSADLTATGMTMGTARYLAPEQVRGEAADARSDVYALTGVLYEALSGAPPFEGPNDVATALARLQRDPVPISQRCPDLAPAVVQVIDRGLARDRDARYDGAEAFRLALSAALRAPVVVDDEPVLVLEDTPAPTFAESERTWLVPTVLLLVVAMALAVAGVLLSQTSTGADLYDRVRDAINSNDEADTPTSSPLLIDDVPTARIEGGRSFDPQGTGSPPTEHEELIPDLFDGDPTTRWTTESYSSAAFGNLKQGVGAIIVLDQPSTITAVEVTSPSAEWSVEIYVSEGAPDDLAGWGAPVATAQVLDSNTRLDTGASRGDSVLLWITQLDPRTAPHRVEIGEVTVTTG